jgi:hypothetical protein
LTNIEASLAQQGRSTLAGARGSRQRRWTAFAWRRLLLRREANRGFLR